MVSKKEVAAAFSAAAAELNVDGDELGGLLFALSKLSEELECFPIGNKKAMVAFARSAKASAGLGVRSTTGVAFTAGGAATLRGLPAVFGTVSRVMHAGESIGTAVRVATSGDGTGDIVLTARHCVEEGGACLHGLSAFGSALLFLAARADLDVAVFRGRRGPGLWLLQRTLLPGEWLGVASFPLAVDQELAADDASPPPGGAGGAAAGSAGPVVTTAAEAPMVGTGVLSRNSATGLRGIASIDTGMPNSSGGAVLSGSSSGDDTLLLAGFYTGTVYHLDEASSHPSTDSGSGGGSSTSTFSSSRSSGSSSTTPSQIELDPGALWTPRADVLAADAVAAAAGDVAKSAELSRPNIKHKNSASIFTTAPALWQLLQAAGVAPPDPEQVAADRAARRTTKRRCR
ncbi:hypothetical protein HYH02_000502 [Chlamydomonas schloesseri]|uniref:Uncharacterized protein n=1 Tax=Chlamydomonas schloesseri TaxID=2026947 RepID=A0A835WUR7_9CHLO|nr:hypothetical protein HYH02_000502 [Chlamydomonas schloesseri]|eukprot:KAG2454663.1 hypothetical protein HYH02_000502 [Chlamydomonas schloesseri]